MKLNKQTTPEAVLTEFGKRLERCRIENGLSQADLAARSGVGKRTIERIEKGCDSQLSTLIRLMNELGLSSRLDQLLPESELSPIAMLHGASKPPARVRQRKKQTDITAWKWGDEK